MRLLLLGVFLLLPLPALAEFVDTYGNPVFPAESYRQLPGGAAYRDLDGQIHYEYVRPSPLTPDSAPSLSPSMHAPPRHDRYELLRETVPGRDYHSDSLFSDRVKPPQNPFFDGTR